MPAGDGTGPMGLGPMTGRGLGYCAGYGTPGYLNPAPRLGWRYGVGWWGRRVLPYRFGARWGAGRAWWGWGRGRGRGWW